MPTSSLQPTLLLTLEEGRGHPPPATILQALRAAAPSSLESVQLPPPGRRPRSVPWLGKGWEEGGDSFFYPSVLRRLFVPLRTENPLSFCLLIHQLHDTRGEGYPK